MEEDRKVEASVASTTPSASWRALINPIVAKVQGGQENS